MKSTRPLSELEGAVLGVIATTPHTTPYALRQYFLRSPAPYWSGSAGAIYPLVRRLVTAGLVQSAAFATGHRTGATYTLTTAGRRALAAWLNDDPTEATVGIPMDPLRTRMCFLETAPPRRRVSIITRALTRARTHMERIDEDCRTKQASGNRTAYLTARGAQLMMASRIAWLEELLQVFIDA